MPNQGRPRRAAPNGYQMVNRNRAIKLFVILAAGLALPAFVQAADSDATSPTFDIQLPLGIPQEVWAYYVPKTNPITAAKVELGRKLFFDSKLSADGTVSCATCHDPARAFTDGRPTSVGIHGRTGQRNAPTVLNALYNKTQFWDGRAETLEAQAALPI